MSLEVVVPHALDDETALRRLRAKADDAGLELDEETPRSGRVSHPLGIHGRYALESGRVVVTIEKRPFFVPESAIREKLGQALRAALGAA